MSISLSVPVHNARLEAIETAIGTSAVLAMMSGSQPATPATAESGTRLVTMALPSDWMSAASAGSKAKLGTWQDLLADAAGTIGYFRVYASDGVTCGMQGSVTLTAGGGDMTVDNTNVQVNQVVTVTGFTLTD